MNDSKLKPVADLKYKARTYTDSEGKEKGVWLTVGTLFSTPHGSHMSIKMDVVPIGEGWNGWLSVFDREDEPKSDQPLSQKAVIDEAFKDNLPDDNDVTKPADFSTIPF